MDLFIYSIKVLGGLPLRGSLFWWLPWLAVLSWFLRCICFVCSVFSVRFRRDFLLFSSPFVRCTPVISRFLCSNFLSACFLLCFSLRISSPFGVLTLCLTLGFSLLFGFMVPSWKGRFLAAMTLCTLGFLWFSPFGLLRPIFPLSVFLGVVIPLGLWKHE